MRGGHIPFGRRILLPEAASQPQEKGFRGQRANFVGSLPPKPPALYRRRRRKALMPTPQLIN